MRRLRPMLLTCLCLVGGAALADREPDPLFQSDDLLELRLSTVLRTLARERPTDDDLQATIEYPETNGEMRSFEIGVRTRGRFRHRDDVCDFPPLRLNFIKSDVRDSLFHRQDKLKLVTHCNSGTRYQQALLREYLAYRIYNLLTDDSFRVRLLRIDYVDPDGSRHAGEHFGFVIEHASRLGKRRNLDRSALTRTGIESLPAADANLASMFHYFIGNTDYSQIQGGREEGCCHNHILFEADDGSFRSVPYDFDQSGLVNAPHASPNPRFGLRNVRQRLYRGRCANNPQLAATIELFRVRRAAIERLIAEQPQLNSATLRHLQDYIESFYRIVDDERRVQKVFVKGCI